MGDVIGPVILGIIISILGISNMKGNISSLHWYHRQRVSPDDVMPFGKRVGLSTAQGSPSYSDCFRLSSA